MNGQLKKFSIQIGYIKAQQQHQQQKKTLIHQHLPILILIEHLKQMEVQQVIAVMEDEQCLHL
jgi:hypothetical protein